MKIVEVDRCHGRARTAIGVAAVVLPVVGKNGNYLVDPAKLPVQFALAIVTPAASTGQCCAFSFLPFRNPAGSSNGGRTLVCK